MISPVQYLNVNAQIRPSNFRVQIIALHKSSLSTSQISSDPKKKEGKKLMVYELIDRSCHASVSKIADPAFFPALFFNRQSFSRRLHRYIRGRKRACPFARSGNPQLKYTTGQMPDLQNRMDVNNREMKRRKPVCRNPPLKSMRFVLCITCRRQGKSENKALNYRINVLHIINYKLN